MRERTSAGRAALAALLLAPAMALGVAAASATTCPAGQPWNAWGDTGFCSPDASGGGSGGDITIDLGGTLPATPVAPAAPVYVEPAGPVHVPAVPVVPAPAVAPLPQIVKQLAPDAAVPAPSQADAPQDSHAPAVQGEPVQAGDTSPTAAAQAVDGSAAVAGTNGVVPEVQLPETFSAAAAVAGTPVSASPSTDALNGQPISDAETAAGGFIAGLLAVLVVAASILYWRKGRSLPDDGPAR